MIHDAPLLLVTVLFNRSAIRRNTPKVRQDSVSSTNGHNWDSVVSRPAGPLGLETSHEITSRDLTYSIAPFRRPIYAVF